MRLSTRWLLAAGLAVSSGCLKRSEPVVFHTLRPLSPAREGAPVAAAALEVMPVRLSEALQRSHLVIARSEGTLEISEAHRWGNGLGPDVQRVLVENLGALLGGDAVVAHPFGERVKAGWRLEVDVQRLDGRPGGVLSLRATWMLTPAAGGAALLRRRSMLEEPVPDSGPEALVAAHDRVLDRLSREIAAGVVALGSVQK